MAGDRGEMQNYDGFPQQKSYSLAVIDTTAW